MQRAKLLMTINAENTGGKLATVDCVEALKEQVTTLTEQMSAMAANQRNGCQPARLLCFYCNQLDHVQYNCWI